MSVNPESFSCHTRIYSIPRLRRPLGRLPRETHHLNVVGEAGEDEAGDDEDHHEETQLRDTLAEGVDDGLETPRVPGNMSTPQISELTGGAASPRQLQYSGQLEHSEDLHQALERVVLLLLLLLGLLQTTGGGGVGEPSGGDTGSFSLSWDLLVHEELYEEWKDGQDIHNVHPVPQEGALDRSSQQSKCHYAMFP